jgi:hypothetical protein
VEVGECEDDRRFHPTALPAVADVFFGEVGELVNQIDRWMTEELFPAFSGSVGRPDRPVVVAMEVVFHDRTCAWTFSAEGSGARMRRELAQDWDLLNVFAGSVLADVVAGRSPWSRALLGGFVRVVDRTWRHEDGGWQRLGLPMVLPYLVLDFDRSQERFVEGQLARIQLE